MNEQPQPGLFIGIDWADQKHDCYVIDRNGKAFHQELTHSPEDIETWVTEMLKRLAITIDYTAAGKRRTPICVIVVLCIRPNLR